MHIIPEPEWLSAIERIKDKKGVIFLLGSTDSGKSTFARYALENLIFEGFKVSLIDSDVGQSSLGLPGTISMKIFKDEEDLKNFRFERMSFIGTINPSKKMGIIINETKRFVDFCRRKSDISILDTTGLISGELGRCLKIEKIRAVRPDIIIAIQREDELKHIIKLIQDTEIIQISASKMAKERKREHRIRYRKKKYEDYFKSANEYLIKSIRFFYNKRQIDIKNVEIKKGLIVGLNHYDWTIALGFVTDIIDVSLVIKSPIKDLRKVNRIIIGDLLID